MSESIFEINDQEKVVKQNAPVQISASPAGPQKIECVHSEAIEPEKVTVLGSEPITNRNVQVGKPMTEDDKARAVMNPFEKKNEQKPEYKDLTLADVPGATEIKKDDQPYAEQGVTIVPGPANEHNHTVTDPGAQKFVKDLVSGNTINAMIRKFGLEKINIEEEKAKIDVKASMLSASQRKAVVALYNMRVLQKRVLAAVAKPMMPAESQTQEKINALIEQVEQDVTEQEGAAKIVAKAIVNQAMEHKPEEPAKAEEVIEDATVEYNPGAGPEDDQTAKVLHDTCVEQGRTQFRGVFSDLSLVDNPQNGDVVHIIDETDPENGTQKETIWVRKGSEWSESGQISVSIPKKDPHESTNNFVVG